MSRRNGVSLSHLELVEMLTFSAVRNNRGPAPDDILLGDYGADKYGED